MRGPKIAMRKKLSGFVSVTAEKALSFVEPIFVAAILKVAVALVERLLAKSRQFTENIIPDCTPSGLT